MKYRDNEIQFIEKDNGYSLRLHNRFGFRWFWLEGLNDKWLKVKKAVEIETMMQNGDRTYFFVSPIVL